MNTNTSKVSSERTDIIGIYQHVKTGNYYKVIGIGRHVDNRTTLLVFYKQLYEGKLKDTDQVLPIGTLWTRDYDEFFGIDATNDNKKRFIKVDSTLEIGKACYKREEFKKALDIFISLYYCGKDEHSLIRGEAAYYIAKMYKQGIVLNCNFDEADRYFNIALALVMNKANNCIKIYHHIL